MPRYNTMTIVDKMAYKIRPIRKVLVANRGEIALRIIRSCREQGIATAAVFSEADRRALHVREADEAYELGPPSASESYLHIERILDVAQKSGADAVHPGYGFLAENAAFAEACIQAGLRFIGPPPEAIRLMGDKTVARRMMQEAGVPVPPGTMEAIHKIEEAQLVAERIGYPVLIKAAAGGGGKGMRLVRRPEEFSSAFRAAQSEARSAFGDERVYVEKYLQEPRHIEFQILADAYGRVIHLFERECSIQRRHQKVIEEAPSVLLTPELRERMGQAAIRAAKACGYVNAGTVEFLVDAERNFYFMEMNTRLQVEHPVTEAIIGLDLVAEQIRIAEGHPLRWRQGDIRMHGHAIESRIYAEDPEQNFLPDTGTLVRYRPPAGPYVRVDDGVEEGDTITMYYDPMIAKLITWGCTREEAIERMERALRTYEIAGVRTTIPFCQFVMGHSAFREGIFSTHFVEKHFQPEMLRQDDEHFRMAAALAAAVYTTTRARSPGREASFNGQVCPSPWWMKRRGKPAPLL